MKLRSSIPGLGYLPARDSILKTGKGFLDSRKIDDGAENLWRIEDRLYDLGNFAKSHPGGEEFINLTRGTDITEIFEVHHITDRARKMLPKFYVKDASVPRRCPFTFDPEGFYKKFMARAKNALDGVDFHSPAKYTVVVSDLILLATISLCLLAAHTKSWVAVLLAGISLLMTTNIAHNYLHMKDTFRVYYFDLSLMSSKEFRITHIMSHHMYTNTLWDVEMYAFEPALNYLPRKNYVASLLRTLSVIYSPFIWTILFLAQAFKRYYVALFEDHYIGFRDVVPLLLPLAMSLVAETPYVAFRIWFCVILISSFTFGLTGLNAGHHHPAIFHDGDVYKEDMDWGILQINAVRNRRVIDDSVFLALWNYGLHCLHHLLPTVDHAYLPLCEPALCKTIKEFGINYESLTQWDAIKGQFQQLVRDYAEKNAL